MQRKHVVFKIRSELFNEYPKMLQFKGMYNVCSI